VFASKLRQAALQRYAVRTETIRAKSSEEQFFDLRRNSVLEPLGLVMGACPVEPYHFREKLFGKLMAHGQAVRHAAALARERDAAAAPNAKQPVAGG
jgi:hypothetical protein